MTQLASPDSVFGDFDRMDLMYKGHLYRLEQRGDEFWVDMDDMGTDSLGFGIVKLQDLPKSLPRIQKRIVLTTGSHHMQIYWYASDFGRKLGQLPFTFLKDDQIWIPRVSAFLIPDAPADTMPMETGRWNSTCIRCHTTQPRTRIGIKNTMDSQVAEFGISCQACHGPAQQHVRANRAPYRRYEHHLTAKQDDTIVHSGLISPRRSAQVCGHCHGIHADLSNEDVDRWLLHGYRYRPGDDLDKTRLTMKKAQWASRRGQVIIKEDSDYIESYFWLDGMVQVSGRKYNGLIESPCFTHGDEQRGIMTCLSCHQMHKPESHIDPRSLSEWANDQLALGMDQDQACL